MVLFVRPTLIAPPVSLCQFTELVTQCSAFPFMVFNASHCSKAMSGFRNVWNEFRVCQGNLKNSLGFYSAAFTLRQKKYFYFFLLTSDTDRNLLHKTQNTKTCTIYYYFFFASDLSHFQMWILIGYTSDIWTSDLRLNTHPILHRTPNARATRLLKDF